ncbi:MULTISPECIES: NAD-dependent protein deacetylase of SIR2 family [unclassified Streptomyces]|uniref:NAD-dependent protein deacetylase of SIR2 family n=1 Tax=unclassified Streptomyces TaxID=2593676 RepID=UPI002366BF40|nr:MULTISPECIES: NAD-dependent protein deacetylase of SIR2 family [unclassified Streptomyces]MDF3141363.1 NAD-dependent protein deacetylase of SIR2 family [Streptomyces sp. T21Q-yed]WDF38841.1 NAD-dependent protein deacetylase of SIR2 family [Streptomyces sp. T12]
MNHPAFEMAAAADTIRTWLTEADRVLITAGAGLSAAAGYDYGDEDRFKELFPALHRLGLRSRYLVGVPLPPALLWGYWAVHVDDIRFSPDPNPLYQRLRSFVGNKDHWVMTSNVDALFARGGFAADRVFTPQGDYGRYQCVTPCTPTTWDSRPLVERLLAAYDPATGAVMDPSALPRCPNCGGEVEINVRTGPEFVDAPYLPAGRRLQHWLGTAPADTRLLILELGAGFNTPGVIRWPGEHLTRRFSHSRLVRVNPTHPETPADLAGRALPVPVGADDLLDALTSPHLTPDTTETP